MNWLKEIFRYVGIESKTIMSCANIRCFLILCAGMQNIRELNKQTDKEKGGKHELNYLIHAGEKLVCAKVGFPRKNKN